MQYDDSESRSDEPLENTGVPKHLALGNCAIDACRWLLALSIFLLLGCLAAWTISDLRRHLDFIPGPPITTRRPATREQKMVTAILRRGGGALEPQGYGTPPTPRPERQVGLSAHDVIQIQRRSVPVSNLSCEHERKIRGDHSITVRTSMSNAKDNFENPASPFNVHYRIVLTYTASAELVYQNGRKFQIILILNMIEKMPALILDFKPCNDESVVRAIERPVFKDDYVQYVGTGALLSTFRCAETEIYEHNVQKMRARIDADLNFGTKNLNVKVCFGKLAQCSTVYTKKVNITEKFYPEYADSVVMAGTSNEDLMKSDVVDIKTWCELESK